jgi:excisionase family DNA binding protein
MNDDDRLLTAEEAARYLGLKLTTVRRLTAAGELPVVHPTGRRAVRYRVRDLAELTRMRTTPIRQGRQTTTDREPLRPLAAPHPMGWES